MAERQVLDLFLELAAIPSPPGEERRVADLVLERLRGLGLAATEDDAAERIGAGAGNVLCRLPGRDGGAGGTPLLLCAHFDTVQPEGPIEPVVGEDGVVRNAAGTILGADDKAAIAVLLAAAGRIVEEGRAHAGVELLFTPMEEVGLQGAAAFDESVLEARCGFVYDQAAPIGEVVLGAPTHVSVDARFRGRAAHAGMYPEEGRSAIAAAARAIADLRLGRVDDESSVNVGLIRGGTGRNVVPEWCSFDAEVRSHDERKARDLTQDLVDACTFAAGLADCEVETSVSHGFRAYRFRRDDLPVRIAVSALERTGFEPSFALSGGGADANVFNERGLPCLNLANGMLDIHTPDERIAADDLERMVDVTLALVDAARDAADA